MRFLFILLLFVFSCDDDHNPVSSTETTNVCALSKGDVDASGVVDVTDIVSSVGYLLSNQTGLFCTITIPENVDEFCVLLRNDFYDECINIDWDEFKYCDYIFDPGIETCNNIDEYEESYCLWFNANYFDNYEECINSSVFGGDVYYFNNNWDFTCQESDCVEAADCDDDGEIGALDISFIVNYILGGGIASSGRILAENITITHDIDTNSINYHADGELDVFYLKLIVEEDSDYEYLCNNIGNYSREDNIVSMYILDGFDFDCNILLNSSTSFSIMEVQVAVAGNYINVILIE